MARAKKHNLSESCIDGILDNKRAAKSAKTSKNDSEQHLRAEGIYYEEEGLQRITPYYHKFATHAKGRWVGRTIFEVFSKEFRDRSVEYYEAAIEQGLIEINGEKVQKDTIVCNSDLVTHYIHRHEPPVTTQALGIVEKIQDGLLLIDKPGSIPVHPTGRYNYNTVTKILEIKHGYKTLFPVNRLDRLTSGLMLVGLNVDVARRMERDLTNHRIQKEYVCKVKGVFPEGKIVCDQPIRVVAHKLSLNCVDREQGKPCLTEFELLSTDGEQSIVYCRPKTGRTHQIRVHLQFLGFPIANDPLYCNREVWGDSMGKDGVLPPKKQSVEAQTIEEAVVADTKGMSGKMNGKRDDDGDNEAWKSVVQRMEEWKTKQELIEHITNTVDPTTGAQVCEKCSSPVLADPTPDELCIWLHAWRYSGPGWSYETSFPKWAEGTIEHIERVKYQAGPSE
ncbi:pseudouridine synthase [Kickxella alabastrina]|uniref:pseudouridine synthase n=1 Tax=Kickxella alabastrina TaxID=61397 RepID=UPI00221E60E8|nr:pseudouridine synthase [Kickxella alabastrina]KAI7824459.1 pseudouridine synthase [Kickxella alabastrina]